MNQELLMKLSRLINEYSPDEITLKEARILSEKIAMVIVDPKVHRIDKVQ